MLFCIAVYKCIRALTSRRITRKNWQDNKFLALGNVSFETTIQELVHPMLKYTDG